MVPSFFSSLAVLNALEILYGRICANQLSDSGHFWTLRRHLARHEKDNEQLEKEQAFMHSLRRYCQGEGIVKKSCAEVAPPGMKVIY
jgi:hypothetical protein